MHQTQIRVIPVYADEGTTHVARMAVKRLLRRGWKMCPNCRSYEGRLYQRKVLRFIILEREEVASPAGV